MPAVYPTLPKLAVRDGYDDDDLTDIDDEVFIRDGKNGGLKISDDAVKKPLMPPRRKCKKSCSFEKHKFPYRALILPVCYGATALAVLTVLIALCIFTADIFPMLLTILRNWLSHELKEPSNDSDIVPCTSLESKVLWTRSLPKLASETPLRSNDVNGDGIDDIIVGFSTGLDGSFDSPENVCALYFDSQMPCLGGVLALNGKTGETLWTHWTAHGIFSVNCGVDLTNDQIKDCIVSGHYGILHAINGRDGISIWEVPIEDFGPNEEIISNDYHAKFVADTDGDGIGDVIASHAMHTSRIRNSEILLISGASGKVIHTIRLPDTEQLYVAPQSLVHPDGENIFVIASSSKKPSGGLYVLPQVSLMYGDLRLRKLHHHPGNEALLPPILVDITSDKVEDIIATMSNSTVVAYDGLTFKQLWNCTIPNSVVLSIPIPGYYNDDDIPDLMVKHRIRSEFATNYHTVATIIDGKTGKSLLKKSIEDSMSGEMSGLSITVEDFGNDWFLHWSVDCVNYEGVKDKYQSVNGDRITWENRVDLCKQRSGTILTNLFALSQHVGPPGISLYFSEDWRGLEYNTSEILLMDAFVNTPFGSVRPSKLRKNHRKSSSSKSETRDIPATMEKYNSDPNYENYGDYKGQKRLILSDLDNNKDNADFNIDYSWRRKNKWIREKGTDKDYEMAYDNDSSDNINDEPNIEYTQADELREQRSDSVDPNFMGDFMNNVANSKSDTVDVSNPTENQERQDSLISLEDEISGDTSSLDRKRREVNLTDLAYDPDNSTESRGEFSTSNYTDLESLTTSESYNSTNATIAPDFNVTMNSSTQETYNATSEVEDAMVGYEQMYVRNFPIPMLNREEDARIEKIFKRESLKDRSERGNAKQRRVSTQPDLIREQFKKERRKKRESGNQSGKKSRMDGIEKQPPTGILLPTIALTNGKTTAVDLVFSTFWLPSRGASLQQEDLECIGRKQVLSENKVPYKTGKELLKECLAERGVDYKTPQRSLGQMTIYRMKLECSCPEDMLPNQSCKNISSHQSWPEHLGSLGNGYFRPIHKGKV